MLVEKTTNNKQKQKISVECRPVSHLVRKHVFFFFGLFPNWSQRIKCSFSTFSRLVSSAYSLGTPFSFVYFRTSLHLSFGLPIFRCPLTSILHVLITTSSSVFLSTWPNHLSVASLIFSSCLPHLPLLLFRLSSSSQSPLFPSIPIYSHHSSQHSHFCSF